MWIVNSGSLFVEVREIEKRIGTLFHSQPEPQQTTNNQQLISIA